MESRTLVNHWVEAPEWLDDRRLWAFYITFEGATALHEVVAAYQNKLRSIDGLDMVDRRWLHLTIQGAAFTDELDAEGYRLLSRAVANLAEREPPLDLVVQRPRPASDAVWMQVIPSRPLDTLRDRLRSIATGILGSDELYALPTPKGGFNPHISIAYANSSAARVDDINAAIEQVGAPDIRIRAPYLSLLSLRRDAREWTWTAEERFPLDG